MAMAHITLPDGTKLGGEQGVYYSTLDDLVRQLREIEETKDRIDESDPNKKRKVQSVNHEFHIRFLTDPKEGKTREQLELQIDVVPINS